MGKVVVMFGVGWLGAAGAQAEGVCEVFVDDETLVMVSEAKRAIAVERHYEHCAEVDTGESVSEQRTMLSFVEIRTFEGRPTHRFGKRAGDLDLLRTAFGGDGAEIREHDSLASHYKAAGFAPVKTAARSPNGCTAAVTPEVPHGEVDPGIYTVTAAVRDAKGARVLTKELGSASEKPGRRSMKARTFWLPVTKTFIAEAHMPQRRVLGDVTSKTVAAGRVAVLTTDLLGVCFR